MARQQQPEFRGPLMTLDDTDRKRVAELNETPRALIRQILNKHMGAVLSVLRDEVMPELVAAKKRNVTLRAEVESLRAEIERMREALRRAADEPNIDKARAIADAALSGGEG
jgi:HAMP domain-containing protein